jgi:hypothetical protein
MIISLLHVQQMIKLISQKLLHLSFNSFLSPEPSTPERGHRQEKALGNQGYMYVYRYIDRFF